MAGDRTRQSPPRRGPGAGTGPQMPCAADEIARVPAASADEYAHAAFTSLELCALNLSAPTDNTWSTASSRLCAALTDG